MHPHHKESHGHKRADHIMKGYKRGGAVHEDEAADKALFKKMIAQHEKGEGEKEGGRVHGKKANHRMDKRARGGAVKKKPAAVVNVMIGKPAGTDDVPMPMARPAMPMMPLAGPPMPPPGMGAGMPPGGPPMLPRKSGGRIPHVGEAMKRTEKMHASMKNKDGFRKGGRVGSFPHMTAGAATGEGRLEKVKEYGKNARP